MEWLIEHWMAIAVIIGIACIGWMMGNQDGRNMNDDGTLRHDSDGRVWVYDDGEWKQLMFRELDNSTSWGGHERAVMIGNLVGVTIIRFTKKEEAALPSGRKIARTSAVLNESFGDDR